MKNKFLKLMLTLVMTLFIIMLFNTMSNAASFDATISTTSVKIGDTLTVTVKANNAAGMYAVEKSNGNLSLVSGELSEFLENNTATLVFKAEKEGTTKITASAKDMTDLDDDTIEVKGSKTFNVTITDPTPVEDPKPAEETPPATTETPSTTTEAPVQEKPKEEPKLSSNSKLKMLGIRPNDFSNFKSSITTYYVTVPYEVSEVEVYAEKQESSQKISGTTDSMSLKVGSNTAKVTCTAEDGTTKTYTIYITREEEVKETVKEEPEEETPVVEEIKTEEETDVAEFIGKEKVLGITAIKVIAKVEEGKDYEPELMPEFREAEYEYQVAVPLTATEVEVNVESDTEATIEVMGNKDLKEGINNVTVMVKIGEDTKIYQIVVNKVEMKPVSTLSDELISQLAVIAAIATAIIVAIIVLVIAIIRSRKKNKVVETDTKVETTEQMQEENMEAGQEQKDENKEE